jgi:hypothetical protein
MLVYIINLLRIQETIRMEINFYLESVNVLRVAE